MEGGPEGVVRRGLKFRPSKGVDTFLGRAKFGEASANYLVRCAKDRNVALHPKNSSPHSIICGKKEKAVQIPNLASTMPQLCTEFSAVSGPKSALSP